MAQLVNRRRPRAPFPAAKHVTQCGQTPRRGLPSWELRRFCPVRFTLHNWGVGGRGGKSGFREDFLDPRSTGKSRARKMNSANLFWKVFLIKHFAAAKLVQLERWPHGQRSKMAGALAGGWLDGAVHALRNTPLLANAAAFGRGPKADGLAPRAWGAQPQLPTQTRQTPPAPNSRCQGQQHQVSRTPA